MNIVYAWELGANWGHLGRLLPVAKEIQRRGHQLVLALADMQAAQHQNLQSFTVCQAPRLPKPTQMRVQPASYAELLAAQGFINYDYLHRTVQKWLHLFEQHHAEIVFIDHAPTAIFAAHIANLPCVQIGNGFEIPPRLSPFPSLRPWEAISTQRLLSSEHAVLQSMNAVLAQFGIQPWQELHELFSKTTPILATYAELDHYSQRKNAHYWGPILGEHFAPKVDWQHSSDFAPKIYAYLRSSMPGWQNILQAIKHIAAEAIIIQPDLQEHELTSIQSQHVRIFKHAVDIAHLTPKCDLAVSYGSNGFMNELILHHVPLALFPQTLEQYWVCARAQQHGWAQVHTGGVNETSARAFLLDAMQISKAQNRACNAADVVSMLDTVFMQLFIPIREECHQNA